MTGHGYGLPLRCENCVSSWLTPGLIRGRWIVIDQVSEVWILKVPGSKAGPCPNCGSTLKPMSRARAPVV